MKVNKLANEEKNKRKNYIDQVFKLPSSQDDEGCRQSTNSDAACISNSVFNSTAATSSCEGETSAVEQEMPVYATVQKRKKPLECVYAVVNKSKENQPNKMPVDF